jgi:glutaredoxin
MLGRLLQHPSLLHSFLPFRKRLLLTAPLPSVGDTSPPPNPRINPHLQIENEPNCDDIQDALQQVTGGRSVPRVFISGKFIGGGDDTAAKQASGELLKLLQAAGVDTI